MGYRMVGMSVCAFSPVIGVSAVGKGNFCTGPGLAAQQRMVQNLSGTKAALAKGNRHTVLGSRPENSWQEDREQ